MAYKPLFTTGTENKELQQGQTTSPTTTRYKPLFSGTEAEKKIIEDPKKKQEEWFTQTKDFISSAEKEKIEEIKPKTLIQKYVQDPTNMYASIPVKKSDPLSQYQSLTLDDIKKMKGSELVDLRIRAGLDKGTEKEWYSSFMAGVGDLMTIIGSVGKMVDQKGGKVSQMGETLQEAGKITQSKYTDYEALEKLGEFDWGDLKDPDWWTNKGIRAVPFTMSLIPLAMVGGSLGVSVASRIGLGALGTAITGAVGATALSRPAESLMEAGGAYDEALAKGMSREKAVEVANEVFIENLKQMSALDVIQMIPFIKNMKGLQIGNVATNRIINILGTGTGIVSEGFEEVLQNKIVSEALGEEFNLFDPETKESFVLGVAMGGVFQGSGGIVNLTQKAINDSVSGKLSPDLKKVYDQEYNNFIKEGKTQSDSANLALNEVAKLNQEQVQEAIKETINEKATELKKAGIEETAIEIENKLENHYKTNQETVFDLGDSASIKVVDMGNNKWKYSYEGNTAESSVISNFSSSELLYSREEAITKAKEALLNWANNELKTSNIPEIWNPETQKTLNRIISEVKNVNAKTLREKAEEKLIVPIVESEDGGVMVEVKSLGKKGYLPLIENYRGMSIVNSNNNYSVWNPKNESLFVVALDDSKTTGKREIIQENNNIESARKYIDWILEKQEPTQKEKVTEAIKEKPKTIKEVAEAYRVGKEEMLKQIENNEAVILDADRLKELAGKSDTKNYAVYSKAITRLYKEALPLVKNGVVKFTAGGSGSGKTDFVTNTIAEDFNGIIMDGTLASYEHFIDRAIEAYNAGKKVEVYGIITDIERALDYVRIREEETGRSVPLEIFVNRHVGAVNTMIKVLENRKDIDLYLKDTLKITDKELAKNTEFIEDKNQALALLKGLEYNENNIINKLQKYDTTRGKREKARRVSSEEQINARRKEEDARQIKQDSEEARTSKQNDKLLGKDRTDKGVKKPRFAKPKKQIPAVDPISAISKLILKKPSLPVLEEFRAKNGEIYSTNLEVAIKLKYDLPDGMYRVVGKEAIKTDTDPADYPVIPTINKKPVAQLSTSLFNGIVKNATDFVSKNQLKVEITGLSLDISPGKITVIATDSFRLYKKTMPAKTDITQKFIVSNPKLLSNILTAVGEKASLSYDSESNMVNISGINGEIYVKTIDGEYPNISGLIPDYKVSYSLDKDILLSALKELKPFVSKREPAVIFTFDDQKGEIKLFTENKDINASKELIIKAKRSEVDIKGNAMEKEDFNVVMPLMGEKDEKGFRINPDYLKSVASTLDTETILMSYVENDKQPILFTERDIRQPAKVKAFKTIREVQGFFPKDINSLENPLVNQMNDKIIKRSDIAKELSEKLNVPIRRGKFRMPKALGIFKPGQKVVRLKKGGLPVIFHEVGHYLDSNYGFSKDINKKEREALMTEYGFKYEGQAEKQRKEAFAEFLRYRLTGQKNKADSAAPIFSDIFDKRLESLPEIKEVLDTATTDYMRWIQQPATAKVLSHISIGSEDQGSFKERAITKLHDLYTAAKDDMHPIREYSKLHRRFTGRKLNLKSDPYILARNLKGWVGKANVFLEQGTFGKTYWKVEENGKTVPVFKGKSFQEIVKPIELAGKTDEFRVYLVSQRVIELSKREKPITTGINPKDAYEAVNELETNNPEFKQAANDLYKYQNDLIDYAIESGLIGTEAGKKIKEMNRFRVPFYRVMEETQGAYMGSKKKIGGNIVSPVKKIKGSEREIIDPIESIIKDTYAIVNAVERNNIGIAMANLANQHFELGRLFEEVDSPMKAIKVNVAEVLEKALETNQLDIGELEIGDLMVNLFRPMQDRGNNMLTVNFGDKQKTFQVEPRLFQTLQGLNVEDLGLMVKIASFPAKLLRAGATLTPDFSIRNPLRDQWTAFIYSKYGFVPGYDFVRGVFELFKKGDAYKLWRMGGGEHSMMVSLDRDYLQNNFDDIVRTKGGKAFQYVKDPIELLRVLSETGEKATRLGEMIRAIESSADPIEGAYSSREVTLDFARMGSKAKAINALIAFFNANVEGMDRLARNFKDYPARTSFRILVSITLPSILLYLLNRDDPRWKELPQWQKDLFWIVFTKDHIIRIPKPFEIGILFGSVPERIMEYMDSEDPEVFDQLKKSVVEGATPGFIPTGLLPIIETISNYSFFLERPIVPRGKEDYPAEAQYGTYTSQTAKELGKIMQFSPSKIDNIIQGYTGGLGRYAVNVIDKVLIGVGKIETPPEPAKGIEDYPVAKAFTVREPVGSSSESVNRVYNLYSKVIGDRNYFNKLKKDEKFEEAEMFLNKSENIMFAPFLTKVIGDFSDINQARDMIRDSKTLTPEEKKERIKELDVLQTEIAQETLKIIKEIK